MTYRNLEIFVYKNFHRNDPIPWWCALIMCVRFNFVVLIFVAHIDYENIFSKKISRLQYIIMNSAGGWIYK